MYKKYNNISWIALITSISIIASHVNSASAQVIPSIASLTADNAVHAYYESIKQDRARLVPFLNDFPKGADLHSHATGAAYIEFGIEYAIENGYYYDPKAQRFVKPSSDIKVINKPECYAVQAGRTCLMLATQLIEGTNEALLNQFLDVVSTRGWHKNTANGSDHFFATFRHLTIPGRPATDYLTSIAVRGYNQGVRYLELMASPVPQPLIARARALVNKETFDIDDLEASFNQLEKFLQSSDFEKQLQLAMDHQERAINRRLLEDEGLTIVGDAPDMVIRYMSQLLRQRNNHEIFVTAAVYMQASLIDDRIVGTNMVQPESSMSSLIQFEDQMRILDYLWTALGNIHDKHPNISLHAGELVLRESPVEAMRTRISDSIRTGHASRIGHGVSIPWEANVAGTLDLMKRNQIAVEICLTSNETILGVRIEDHPFTLYRNAGVPVTIATDDEGVSRSNLTMEYVQSCSGF